MIIKTDDVVIRDLLKQYLFSIPRFQRPYSWGGEQIQAFWEDLGAVSSAGHFMGSIVLYPSADGRFALVDGQQRLMTITILLAVIREHFKVNEDDELAVGTHSFIEGRDEDNKRVFVIHPETSYPYFQHNVLVSDPRMSPKGPVTPEEQAIKDCWEFLHQKIHDALDGLKREVDGSKVRESVRDYLKTLRKAVMSLRFIKIEVDSEEGAYTIFETINTRGLELSASDLVKNHIFRLLPKEGALDEVKNQWSDIAKVLYESSSDIDFDTFLYHWWASKEKVVPLKKLYSVIKRQVCTGDGAIAFLEQLSEDVKYYRMAFEPDFRRIGEDGGIHKSLTALNLFKVAQPTPMILSLLRANGAGVISNSTTAKALRSIENFHFLFTAITSSRSSGGIQQMYAAHAAELSRASSTEEAARAIERLRTKLRKRCPSRDDFIARFIEIEYRRNDARKRPLIHYILQGLGISEGVYGLSDTKEITIEHICPIALAEEMFPDNPEVVFSVGNLMLLPKKQNSDLGSLPAAEKIRLLRESRASLPAFVGSATEWTADHISRNGNGMAEKAYDIWAV